MQGHQVLLSVSVCLLQHPQEVEVAVVEVEADQVLIMLLLFQ